MIIIQVHGSAGELEGEPTPEELEEGTPEPVFEDN
jgi:hypothetical protein